MYFVNLFIRLNKSINCVYVLLFYYYYAYKQNKDDNHSIQFCYKIANISVQNMTTRVILTQVCM